VHIATTLTNAEAALSISVGPVSTTMELRETFVAAALALAVSTVCNLVAAVLIARLSVTFLNRTRKRAISAFLGSTWDLQSRERTGRLQELLSGHVNRISQAVYAITSGLNSGLSFVALMVSALVIQPLAAAVLIAAVVVLGVALLPLSRLTKRRSAQQVLGHTQYAMDVAELVAMSREVNAFGVWDGVRDRLARRADAVARQSFITRTLVRGNPILYQTIAMALLLGAMAVVYSSGAENVTGLSAVVILMVRAMAYSQQINTAVQQASEVAPFVDELEAQIAAYSSAARARGTVEIGSVERLSVRRVSFSYGTGPEVLRDVSFEMDRGAVIGVVGPSGSGKSTLMQVVLGLRRPTSGTYLVNDTQAHELDEHGWTRAFALVPQDQHLFLGTVYENLGLFRDISEPEIERAATLAHVHDEIARLPEGYRTRIGPGALDLSGGQRQRLGLARALAGRPDVLVLDEPTSALDMRSETLVQQTLTELKVSRTLTMFIVAHRLSTLSVCDRIIVLQDGRITADGTFGDLQRDSPFFRDAIRLSQLPA
jgi:ABC-type multidrug transport system fused ATPase/permease subunit